MPIIDLGKWPEKSEVMAIHRLWAIMLYPDDQEMRDQFMVIQLAKIGVSLSKQSKVAIEHSKNLPDGALELLEIYVQDLRERSSDKIKASLDSMDDTNILLDSPSAKEADEQYRQSYNCGMVAGEILVLLKQMSDSKKNVSPSKRKAVELLVKLRAETLRQDGWRAANREYFDDAWKGYRTVSHLWATQLLFETNKHPDEYNLESDQGLIGFLNVTEQFRQFITSFMPTGSKDPLVTNEETWNLPDNLPKNPIKISLPPLSAEQLKVLGAYHPSYE